MDALFSSDGAALLVYPLVAVWRWGSVPQRPGTYRIVFAFDSPWVNSVNAVVDDFGNLVAVA